MKPVSAALMLLALGTAGIAAQAQQTTNDGVFTLEQAVAGESIYRRECAICHGANLGGGEGGSALIGSAFLAKWEGFPLGQLYTVMSFTMPLVNPGGLSERQYHESLAYIMLANGFEPGDEPLSGGMQSLAGITIEQPSGENAAELLAALDEVVIEETGLTQEWLSHRSDPGSSNYSSLDLINKSNVDQLEIAWRWKTDNFGAEPEFNYQATPIMANGMLYTTAGNRRAAVAIDARTGETLWMHRLDEGRRGELAPRGGSGRGVAYAEVEIAENVFHPRVYYITPGYNLVALDAATGQPIPGFGNYGVVDLKQNLDQEVDLVNDPIGSSSPPVVVNGAVIVGSAFPAGRAPSSPEQIKGHVTAYDAVTGERLWIFHTIPSEGEAGYETWLEGSAEYTGNVGVWAPFSADPELNMVYLPVEAATGDYYGGHRPGDNLYSQSLVALDAQTGERVWHFQTIHHGIWDYDPPAPPILMSTEIDGESIPIVAQVTKQGFTYVFDRRNGEPVWPIEERPVPQSQVPGERVSPTQPFPVKPEPFVPQGVSEDQLNDLTPEIFAEAKRLASSFTMGPLFTPPTLITDTNGGTLFMPGPSGGANWQGAVADLETNRIFVSATPAIAAIGLAPSEHSTMQFVAGRGAQSIEPFGLPLGKPPYGTITAIDMNSGEILWQIANGDTPDFIANHPKLEGVDIPRTGHGDRVGQLVTKSLLFAGEGSGLYVSWGGGNKFRAHDKDTGEILHEFELPASQTGMPMTYAINGQQYILVPVGAQGHPGELVALTVPQ